MLIPYFIKSMSIGDIDVDAGTTVGRLRDILKGAGYDVLEADIAVNRHAQGDTLVGKVDSYVLKDGDTIEFNTDRINLPNMGKLMEELFGAPEKKPEPTKKSCCRGCGGGHEDGVDPSCRDLVNITDVIDQIVSGVRRLSALVEELDKR